MQNVFEELSDPQKKFNPFNKNFKPEEGPLNEITPEVMKELLKEIMECAGK